MGNYEHCKDIFKILRTHAGVYRWDHGCMVRVGEKLSASDLADYREMQRGGAASHQTGQDIEELFRDKR